ncbi:uncharacterized protein [Bactrocera oleae]|uniref:uncharacterized protein n=1 Tax=Bactrocera oleae TaxID=104688 RepID=UPI00387E67AD
MTDVCKYCKALKWKEESTGICCSGGKVRLDPIEQPPEPLQSLLCGDHIYSQHFLNNIRRYNSAFQMTSFGAKEANEGNFMPTFKVQGQVYHLIGSLLPKNNQRESFLQIYFLSDYKQQRDTRLHHFPVLNASLLECLQSMLDETNPYVRDFKTALQLFPTDSNECNYKIVINTDHRPSTEHRGRHNEPATNEVSVLLVDQQCDKRDIILHRKNDSLQRIAETHRSYDALQYPLMFVREIKITAEQIDDVISAELPDKEDELQLFEIVKTHMVHGPCGVHNPQCPCMKNGICSKKFPKAFTTETVTGEDGYPFYRRRSPKNGGRQASIQSRTKTFNIDNRWIVPFSPVLLRAFKAHINVELCNSVKSIKYICKYVNKGSDLAIFSVQNDKDEITSYQNGRYISTSEAVWRMLSFSIHERFPPVTHLDVHLENGQRVYIDPSNIQEAMDNPKNTTLMAFFKLCQSDEFATTLLYEEVKTYYTFNKNNGTFQRRRRGTPVNNYPELWNKFKSHFIDDFSRNLEPQYPDADINSYIDDITNRALLALQNVVLSIGGNTIDHYGLPSPYLVGESINTLNREYIEQTNFNPIELQHTINNNEPKLNNEQNQIYQLIIEKVNTNDGGVYFLDAPGGTGKTFLINLILAKIRSEKKIAIAVASSGIAATLLPGGKTAHSMFKIPIEVIHMENPVCGISKNSYKAKVLQDCVFVVWDECTMANKVSIEAVNRTMKDLRNNNQLFGGVVFLFAGDFRQTLPVIAKGTRTDEVNACLKRSVLWNNIEKLHLKENMRAQSSGAEFCKILLDIGEGKYPEINSNHDIEIPSALCHVVADTQTLISDIYDDIHNLISKEDSWLCERSILAPRNDRVSLLNTLIMEKIPGNSTTYLSINTICQSEQAVHYPVEFLNSINAPGLPQHQIDLNIGIPIMLLRNLNPPKLCNGTRLRVISLQKNIIEAVVMTGYGKGETVFIPRIPIIPSNYPFQFKRLQFPINVSFAMTINKSQAQTLKKTGIDLSQGCFSHGQLYVACSRVSEASNIVMLTNDNCTPNIVYKKAL